MSKTFTAWIKNHSNEGTAIGDLARDMISDKELDCRKVRSFSDLRNYMEERDACAGAMNALIEAYWKYPPQADACYECGNITKEKHQSQVDGAPVCAMCYKKTLD